MSRWQSGRMRKSAKLLIVGSNPTLDSFNPVDFHGINLIQNRLTGRTPPFEGVYLGSNPSSGTSPIDGIGIHTCLRNKVLQVRVLYRALDFISKHMQDWSNGKTRDSKPFNVGSIPTSCALSF